MRPSKLMAVGISGCALAAAAMMPAIANPGHQAAASKTHQFPSTLNTHSPKSGQKLVLKGHGAQHGKTYDCVLGVFKGSAYTIDGASLTPVKSSKKGKITCSTTYKPYTATSLTGGKSHHCPLTKKDKKAHWKCGYAASTTNKSSATIQYFSPK